MLRCLLHLQCTSVKRFAERRRYLYHNGSRWRCQPKGLSSGGPPTLGHDSRPRPASCQLQTAKEGSQRGDQNVESRYLRVRRHVCRYGAAGDLAASAPAVWRQERSVRVCSQQTGAGKGMRSVTTGDCVRCHREWGVAAETADSESAAVYRETPYLSVTYWKFVLTLRVCRCTYVATLYLAIQTVWLSLRLFHVDPE